MRHIVLMTLATLALAACAYEYPSENRPKPDVVYYDNDYYPTYTCSRWEYRRGLCGQPIYHRCTPSQAQRGWC